MDNICNFELQFKDRKIPAELQEMLEMILQKDPSRRASLEDLKKCRFINNELPEIKR